RLFFVIFAPDSQQESSPLSGRKSTQATVRICGASSALTEGSYTPLKARGDLLLFGRELREERILIALNLGPEPIAVSFADELLCGQVLLSSFADRDGEEVRAGIDLRGNEGLLMTVNRVGLDN
ncbi:hypothetical protein QJT78_51910, partial [Bradyrhizobium sp. Mp27]|nr:hypothetical protein [Bradyrhizobium sp. Mp27]